MWQVVLFTLLQNSQAIFQSGHIIVCSYCEQCRRVPIFLYPRQHLLLAVFLIISSWWDESEVNLIVDLNCISLRINDVKHLFICFLAICTSSCTNGECHSNFLPIFNWVIFLLLGCKSFSYILDTSTLLDIWFTKNFHSVGCPFTFVGGAFWSTDVFLF